MHIQLKILCEILKIKRGGGGLGVLFIFVCLRLGIVLFFICEIKENCLSHPMRWGVHITNKFFISCRYINSSDDS